MRAIQSHLVWCPLVLALACAGPEPRVESPAVGDSSPAAGGSDSSLELEDEPADVEFRISRARALWGVGVELAELHIEGRVRYARILVWVDRDGTGLPTEDRYVSRLELRPTEPDSVTLRNLSYPYHRNLMGEILVEDVEGRRKRHIWRIH